MLRYVTDPETLPFWREEITGYTKSFRSEAIAPILNKAGQFTASPQLRLVLGQVAPRLDLAFTMNNRRIVIANLAKGVIGEQASNLLGSLLVSHLQLIAMERSSPAPQKPVPFFAHVDEFQTFSSDAFASLLSEARKFATHFALANQYTDQLPHAVRSAVIGNAGSLVVFPVGSRDAEIFAPEFRPMGAGRSQARSRTPRGCAAASAAIVSSRSRSSMNRSAPRSPSASRAGSDLGRRGGFWIGECDRSENAAR
jgi:hypothetical protein